MNKRIEWIDIAKFICMFCVINVHLNCTSSILFNVYYPFYLAGFFMCSGYCYKQESNVLKLITKKAKQLLIPWFIYSNANILISQIISIKDHKDIKTELLHNLLQVRNYDERLWFLVSLFVSFIPFYYLVKYVNKDDKNIKKGFYLVCLLFFIKKIYSYYVPGYFFPWDSNKLPWHIDYIPTALLSMYTGYCIKNKYEAIIDKNNCLITKIIYSALYFFLISVRSIAETKGFVVYSLYDFFSQIAGILFITFWSKSTKINKLICFVGRNTLLYFCIHNKFATVVEYIASKAVGEAYNYFLTNVLLATLLSLALTFLIIIILIPFVYAINRYLGWTLGRTTRRNFTNNQY